MVRQPASRPASISRQRSPTKLLTGAQYHAGLRLTAVALLSVVMLTNLDRVERQTGGEPRIDLIDIGAARFAARDIGLVGNDNQQKAFALQFLECCAGAVSDNELLQITRRVGLAIAYNCSVQYAIAIEKDGRRFRRHR